MSLPAASFEPVISYLNLASPGAEIRSGKTDKSASLRRSGHTTRPLNWQIMSQPECHNFKILLQTTNNFTSDEIFRQNRIKICENTSVFILFGNVFFDANNRSRGARAAARETNSFTLQLWLWNNMPFLQFHNFNLFKSF